jgi:hypothetical protein
VWDAVDAAASCARWDRRAGRKIRERSRACSDEGCFRGRRSRVVLTPRRRRQVSGVLVGPTGLEQGISADDGDKNARSPGRARNKPLKPLRAGMPGDSGVPVASTPVLSTFAQGAAGAAGTRHSPRPPWGREINLNLGRIAPRDREAAFERHCEPTGRANARPMTGSAKQSILSFCCGHGCFAEPVARNDGSTLAV